jgi:hypothetical protein
MPKPLTDEQFAADLVKRIKRHVGSAASRTSAVNLAFTVATMLVGQIDDDDLRDMTVGRFSTSFAGAVDRYRGNAKISIDAAKAAH